MVLISGKITTGTSLLWLLMFSAMVIHTISDASKDREECAELLASGMATCLPYVEGQAKTPTPDCCSGLKQVLQQNKKCLCVIIRDRNDPDLGLTINVTLALGLPSTCHATANVSKCPELLHLAPNSPEAQVFYQFANNGANSSSNATDVISPTASTANSPSSTGASATIAPISGNSGGGGKGLLASSQGVNVGGLFALAFNLLFIQ